MQSTNLELSNLIKDPTSLWDSQPLSRRDFLKHSLNAGVGILGIFALSACGTSENSPQNNSFGIISIKPGLQGIIIDSYNHDAFNEPIPTGTLTFNKVSEFNDSDWLRMPQQDQSVIFFNKSETKFLLVPDQKVSNDGKILANAFGLLWEPSNVTNDHRLHDFHTALKYGFPGSRFKTLTELNDNGLGIESHGIEKEPTTNSQNLSAEANSLTGLTTIHMNFKYTGFIPTLSIGVTFEEATNYLTLNSRDAALLLSAKNAWVNMSLQNSKSKAD